ncbi:MAG: ATP-binding cassette domain-containing protein [Marinilabiliales bacterium]|nr:MAG: ATP-binding cassette domain-containing protein [Marinilabiliales bacterium]
MSQQILRALMQLFAIIARPESNKKERISVVESFLKRQLSKELVDEYLTVFENYYEIHQEKAGGEIKKKKRTSSSSVRVLVICTKINEELNQRQKIIVFVNLLEFVKSDSEVISDQEFEFLDTVALSFNISGDEYENIKNFVLKPFEDIPRSGSILVVDGNRDFSCGETRHIYREAIEGQIRVLSVAEVSMYLVRYIGESEMYLNSQLIQQDKVYVFDSGTSIRNPRIKPVYFSDVVSTFSPHLTESKLIFEARNIEYRFRGGNIGLQRLSFTEESGRMIGIMGSSGSGKSTLLNVLNGSLMPYRGEVLVNNIDIHREKGEIEGLIGHVSQDDLLIEELTVYQNLYYNAKLCFDHYTEEETVTAVNSLLQQLGLYEARHIQVGSPLNKKISGGQRKRLNIALELIREPAILFLDEPTSGLSSRDSENILDLLKELALKGKLIFVVLHQPSSDIFKMFDNLLILDTGGFLIYNGDPVDAIIYFKSHVQHANWNESECHACGNVNPEQLFNIIETNVLDEFGKQTHSRKISPWEWAYYQLQYSLKNEKTLPSHIGLPEVSFRIPDKFRQFLVFVKRDLLSKIANRQYMFINFLEAPVLAFLLSFIIKYRDVNVATTSGYTFAGNLNVPVYIFMSVIVAIFIGLTVSAEEIIKDRKILKREAFLNLSWSSYLSSKIVVLFGISAIQALLFVLVGNSIIEIRGMYFEYWLVLFSAWCFSNVMGLIISDSFKTVVTIYILIPFLVIPQLILSGIIVKFEELNPSISSPSQIPLYGEIITARWAYEALAVHQFTNNPFEYEFYPYNKAMSRAEYMNNFWLRNLQNKLDFCKRNLGNPSASERMEANFRLLVNELSREQERNRQIEAGADFRNYPGTIPDKEFIEKADEYLALLNRYYIHLYNSANNEKDRIITEYHQTDEGREQFLERRNRYHNETLSDLVRNSREVTRIIEYNYRLHQRIDPVYRDPEGRFIKAHFYSPEKRVFGNTYGTLWVNTAVIWIMTVILFLALYFRLLKKMLEWFEDQPGIMKKLKGVKA